MFMTRKFLSCFFVILFLLADRIEAASLGVSPSAMAYNDTGVLTLSVTGLPGNGGTVRVDQYVDANGNASIDAGEIHILSFFVTDGEVAMFAGERNFDVPGDEDGAADGAVMVELTLRRLPEFNRAVASYIFRISSPSAAFAPVTQPFTVTQAGFGQAVRGTVMGSGEPLSGALVAFLDAATDGQYAAGVLTDATGRFSLNVPPGDYMLAGVKNGFLMNMFAAPFVTVSAGVDSTQNVTVVAADRTISGRVFDGVTSNGLAGMQIFAGSLGDGAITVVHSDADGNFTVPVVAGPWRLEPSEDALRLLGYTSGEFTVDASGESVANVQMPLTHGRGRLELVFFFPGGSFGAGTNGTIPFPTHLNYYYALFNLEDVNFPTNVYFTGPSGSGLSNTASAVFGANFSGDSAWYSSPQIDIPPHPPGGIYAVNYKGETISFRLLDPESANRQVLLVPTATVSTDNVLEHIRWTVRDMNGNPIAMPPSVTGIQIRIDGMGGRIYEAEVAPNETEHLVMGYVVWTNVSSIEMVYGDNAGNQYVAFWNRTTQPLQILTASNLPPAQVGVPYQHLFVVAGGQSPYVWSLNPPGTPLPGGLTFGGTGELSGIPTAAGTFSFTVRVTDMNQQFIERAVTLQVQPSLGFPRVEPVLPMPPGQFRVRVSGQAGQSYTLQYSTTLSSWADVTTVTAPSDTFEMADPGATDGWRIYRVRRNP